MKIEVRRFRDSDLEAIERLNRRLEAGDCEHRLYKEDLSINPDQDLEIRPVNDALYVVADGDEVRGGAWLREQYFWVDGERHRVGWMKYPVSESLVDREYAGVPASMVLQFLRRQPRLMAVGMGGHDGPFARLLAGIGWASSTIPFFFRILRPARVLRGLEYARRRGWLRALMDVAAWTGVGWAAHRAFLATAYRVPRSLGVTCTVEPSYASWGDGTWERCRDGYRAIAVRDARTLDFIYPSSRTDLGRLRVSRGGADIGWLCFQVLPPGGEDGGHFGDLKVAFVIDVLALPADAATTLALGVKHLESLGVDLVITYLNHAAWIDAARRLRFLRVPSRMAFYRSKQVEQLLVGGEAALDDCHFTHSDGHGPV